MQAEIIAKLLAINEEFYQRFGAAFAATRRRIQPGVQRALEEVLRDGDWLDLGCGSGAILTHWIHSGIKGSYIGLDFSEELLSEAQINLEKQTAHPGLEVQYTHANLLSPYWHKGLESRVFDGVLAFASLHHLPGNSNRLKLIQQVDRLLKPGSTFILSNWQFHNSPKMMSRVQPWSTVGITETDVEAGDTLLDWRHAVDANSGERGLRYVHLFQRSELAALASQSGFTITDEFESDGKGGNLALYQVWRKPL